jgi:hypothetical protein
MFSRNNAKLVGSTQSALRHPADEGSENIARFRQALMTNDGASRKAFAARQLRPTVF